MLLMENQKIIHLQFVQTDRPKFATQIFPRVNPKEEKTPMDNSTTLYSLPWTT